MARHNFEAAKPLILKPKATENNETKDEEWTLKMSAK